MKSYKEELFEAWKNREGPAVFTTTSRDGVVNSVYVSSIDLDSDGNFVIADNYFGKTNKNIDEGSIGSVLFITKDVTSYQAKGNLTSYTRGPSYDFMKGWNPSHHPGHKAVVLSITSLYRGGDTLL